jgi:hypothetical protein
MATKVLIEKILPIEGHGQYVFVRPVIPGKQFFITEKTFLYNLELEPFLDAPRKIKEDGQPDLNLFAVRLKNTHEAFRLKEKSVVDLVPGDSPCLPPWHFADKGLSNQLQIEIGLGHILFGKEVKTIARRQDNDDVLFGVFDSDFKYAKVHLTWSNHQLTDTHYPSTITYKDWVDVYDRLIIPDNKDWT